MRVVDLNWMQLEDYLERDDRVVLPLGCTEQHAYLSVGTDTIIADRIAAEAAEPLSVPVLPALAYGFTPAFAAYPGSPTLRLDTFLAVVADLLDSLHEQGFGRILVLNAHGGNAPAEFVAAEWVAEHSEAQVIFHSWWNSAKVRAVVDSVDGHASHASWMEAFPWTRIAGVELPDEHKPATPVAWTTDPETMRELLGDGSMGGWYDRPAEQIQRIWAAGVDEIRELLERGWRS